MQWQLHKHLFQNFIYTQSRLCSNGLKNNDCRRELLSTIIRTKSTPAWPLGSEPAEEMKCIYE